nr:MAG: hypothetical protein [Agrostis stolonifera deltaflexivirus 1]
MASVLPNPGPPELTDDLGLNFAAVAALFITPVERASTLVIAMPPKLSPTPGSSAVAQPPLVVSASPSENLSPFWRKHSKLLSFIMISYSAFSENYQEAPSFPAHSVDLDYAPGQYILMPASLQFLSSGKWKVLHAFGAKGVPLTPHSAESKPRYFLLK